MDISHVPTDLLLDDHSCHSYVPCFSDKQLIFSHGDEAVRTRHGAMITWLQPGWQWMAVLQRIYSVPVLQSRRVWLIESKWQVPSTSMSVAQPNQKIIIKIPKIIIESKHIQKSYQIFRKFAEFISHMMFTPFYDLPVSFGMVLLSETAVVVIEAAT